MATSFPPTSDSKTSRTTSHDKRRAATILVVEDDENIAYVLSVAFTHHGFASVLAKNLAAATSLLGASPIDLVVLDVMLPDGSGLDWCASLRRQGNEVPLIFLTALGTSADKIAGLSRGGDDYLEKPFHVDELIERVRAVLRRSGSNRQNRRLRSGDVVLYEQAKRVECSGVPVTLSPTEFKLLQFLFLKNPAVVSKAEILSFLWQSEFDSQSTVVERHISSLRRKLGGESKEVVQTVRAFGYCLVEPVVEEIDSL